ncbi:MAG: urate hydroxylase PuuD, partial [Gemmatimonadota bacterium]|nr:urate hydroxylase PuuD [Gemmatimonadota bacterium]
IWLLHSGAFYYVDKTLLGGRPLPKPLHWFVVQAMTTWWSGVVLLIAVYWAGGRAAMTDPGVALLSHNQAVMVGIGAIIGGRVLYEAMQRLVAPRAPRIATTVWVAGLTAIAVALTQLLSGRAAFLHVGAMLGTLMALNVASTIVPSQKQLVASIAEGRAPDPAVSARAKRVSIHNNYFVFPVIVLMISSHFPTVYGNRLSWALLLILIVAGVVVRHVLNIRYTLRTWPALLAATMVLGLMSLYSVIRLGSAPAAVAAANSPEPVSFADVRSVIDRRCTACHSALPSDRSFGAAPGGVLFDTPEQIESRAARIHDRAVVSRTMPPANKTAMTEAERALLGRWATRR